MNSRNCIKNAGIFFVVLCMATSLTAQNKVTNSVFGSGGTPTTGSSNRIVGTVGQPAIGQTISPANGVSSGFWAQAVDIVTGVEQQSSERIPDKFQLEQNYPNPFNPTTTIQFSVPQKSFVTLKLYDLLGRLVATLVDASFEAGVYKVNFSGNELSSGIYFYRLTADRGFERSRKLTLLK